MKILLAGATGFIGSHLVPALLSAGHEVHALVRNAAAARPGWSDVRCMEANLVAECPKSLPSVEAVVHLAQANVPFPAQAEELLAVNCTSAVTLAAHAQRCGAKRMIFASSGTVYGFSPEPITEAHPLNGAGFYAQTKIAAERLLGEFRAQLPVDLLRIFSPYGPGQQATRLIPDIIRRVREGRAVTVRENGMPALTPVYVSDVVAVILARLTAADSVTMNVAGEERVGIREVAECAAALLGCEAVFEINPAPLDGGIAADASLMTRATGVRPISMTEGVERFLAAR